MTTTQKRALDYLENPTEDQEQATLFQWADAMSGKYPQLRLLYHIPNGGLRNKTVARHLKAQGVKSGVPDICLPVAQHGYHALYIEMKRRKGNKTTENQNLWIKALNEQGNLAVVCYGNEQARNIIERYLGRAEFKLD